MLRRLHPDAVLFVGDLAEEDLQVTKVIKEISLPTAVILGNHDRGHDQDGSFLAQQLKILGPIHCGWRSRDWESPNVSVVGARPCTAGGGYYLSKQMQAVFGPVTLEESVFKIVSAAMDSPKDLPLIILAHSGPSGLGSAPFSICGRDWKSPAIDWGDKDLSIAIDQIRQFRDPEIVVFGHMHHKLKRGGRTRDSFVQDRYGTCYLNSAIVPRKTVDLNGDIISHLSWIEFHNGSLRFVAHRWYYDDATIAYEQVLLK